MALVALSLSFWILAAACTSIRIFGRIKLDKSRFRVDDWTILSAMVSQITSSTTTKMLMLALRLYILCAAWRPFLRAIRHEKSSALQKYVIHHDQHECTNISRQSRASHMCLPSSWPNFPSVYSTEQNSATIGPRWLAPASSWPLSSSSDSSTSGSTSPSSQRPQTTSQSHSSARHSPTPTSPSR